MKLLDTLKISLLNIKSNKFKSRIFIIVFGIFFILLSLIFSVNKTLNMFIDRYINADFQLQDNIIDSSLYILNSNNIETIKDAINRLAGSIDTIIIDSLPMLTNKENNADKVISEVQRIISICNRNKIDLYIINQYRMNNKCENYTYYLNRLRLYYNKRIKVG